MRVLIVYASRHGQTRKIAEHVAHIATIHGAEAHAREASALPAELRVNAFDTVVLAGPVYFDKFPKKLVRFAAGHREALSKVRSVFVSVSGAAGNPALRAGAEEVVRLFLEKTRWTPDQVELFAGGQPFTRYGFFTKWMMVWKMRKLGRDVDPNRDYESTDWDAVDSFARALAARSADVRAPELALM
jgi:menaquinone-dependent protoporphyrinogen oxidase